MRILSFSIAHDSSVCSIVDGEIEFFCKEERLSRKKRDMHPFKSLELYKDTQLGKIDHILYNIPSNNQYKYEFLYSNYVEKIFNVPLENYSHLNHHKCHASLAFYNSGYDEAIVIVVDRNGSIFFIDDNEVAKEAESVYTFSYPDNIQPLHKSFCLENRFIDYKSEVFKSIQNFYPSTDIHLHQGVGVVKAYEAATTLINQHPLENGKTMGLSAYGTVNEKYLMDNNFILSDYFSTINTDHFKDAVCFANQEHMITNDLTTYNYNFYADKAKQVQDETQDYVLSLIKKYTEKTKIKNVCIVGGYGLNVVANAHYLKELPEVNFYFEPLSDDTGISIGAAMLKYRSISKDTEVVTPKDNFYHYYCSQSLNLDNLNTEPASIEKIASLLAEQKSVAIFEGAPEAGPRALGHRSILFDARNCNAKEIVNRIKNREWYRPFAGIILQDYTNKYFDTIIDTSEYMTVNFTALSHTANVVPGIIHVDNTSRLQTVKEGSLYSILTEFNNQTECPMLLNTSFNLAGQPLVQTKQDAIDTLLNSSLDYIYFVEENILVRKKDAAN